MREGGVKHLRAQSDKEPVQGVRRGQHLRAQSDKAPGARARNARQTRTTGAQRMSREDRAAVSLLLPCPLSLQASCCLVLPAHALRRVPIWRRQMGRGDMS